MTEYPVSTDEALAQAVSHINAAETGAKIRLVLGADVNLTQSIKPQNAIDLEVCSAEGGHCTITARNFSGAQSVFEIEDSNLTLRDITVKLDAATYGGYHVIYESNYSGTPGRGNVNLINCTLDGSMVERVYGIYLYCPADSQLTLQGSTIKNFPYAGVMIGGHEESQCDTMIMEQSTIRDCGDGSNIVGGVELDGDTSLRMKRGSSITDCVGLDAGGVWVSGSNCTLIMESGSSITGCHGNRTVGGVYLDDESDTLAMEEGSKIYNNTSDIRSNDIYIGIAGRTGATATLVNAAAMKATAKDGHTIDGWYLDNENARYDRTAHADPITETTITANDTTGGIGLVASYGVYDIAFDGENAAGCTAYSDSDRTKAITAAAPGDKVYLKYTGALNNGLTAEQCIGWDAATGDDTAVPVYAYDPGYFFMPAKPAGNKVTLTPKVMNIADAIEEPAAPAAPADGGAGGAIAAVAIGAAAAVGVYEAGTGIYRMVNMQGVALPTDRIELARAIWEKAGKPEPENLVVYSDMNAEDVYQNKAASWVVEQGLMDVDENQAFRPYEHVTKLRVCITWDKAKQQGLFDQAQ